MNNEEAVAGATFAYGPVTIGYQRSIEMTGLETAGAVEYYQNNIFGISFNFWPNIALTANLAKG